MKRIAMSDLHLGQDADDKSDSYSLLSNIPGNMEKEKAQADAKMAKLRARVEKFADGDSVKLILCGDVLDLSLAYFAQAYLDLAYLLKNLPSVAWVAYVPGNHDHHIWSLHCEQKNIIRPLLDGGRPWGGGIYTPTVGIGEMSHFLTNGLTEEVGRNVMVDIAYPSYRLGIPNQSFYFTHGHLFGGLYNLFSRILSIFLEEELDEGKVATMNVALIEFIYWLCGETGEGMGSNGIIEALYADTKKGKDSLIRQILDKGVDEVLPDGIIKGIPDSWERAFVKWAANKGIKKTISGKPHVVSSKARHEDPKRTQERVEGWLFNVLKADKENKNKLTFVFGHTHRSGLTKIGDNISVYNLGSWLTEPGDEDPDTELLMIDDYGNTTMERI